MCEIVIAHRKPKNAPHARTSQVSTKWVCTRTSQLATAHRNSQLAIAHRKSCLAAELYSSQIIKLTDNCHKDLVLTWGYVNGLHQI